MPRSPSRIRVKRTTRQGAKRKLEREIELTARKLKEEQKLEEDDGVDVVEIDLSLKRLLELKVRRGVLNVDLVQELATRERRSLQLESVYKCSFESCRDLRGSLNWVEFMRHNFDVHQKVMAVKRITFGCMMGK